MSLVPQIRPFFDDFEHAVSQHWRQLVEDFFQPRQLGSLRNRLSSSGYPKVDVFQTDGQYRIEATVPGVKPEDLRIEAFEEDGNHYLRLTGHVATKYQDSETDWHVKEIRRSQFTRVVPLPDGLEGEPEAVIKDGILTLSWALPKQVPKKTAAKVIELKRENCCQDN